MEAGGAGATARGSDAQIAGVQSGRPGQIQVMLVIIGKIISGAALDRPLVLVEKDQADTDQRHADRGIEDHGLLRVREAGADQRRSEEHTSELQSLMRISYAVFCLKK